ncbi:MAG TPA: PQQ-dependent sugar dehydrogenase [Pyrinomonadaceae bacterium]|nr:PQQ-dependent sugar dehydrogenase [Pyrinomonadaceae bacterium]
MPRFGRASLACIALLLVNAIPTQAQRRRARDTPPAGQTMALKAQRVSLADGRTFNLNLPEGFRIAVAAEGLKRVRFMSLAPDGRVFVTDMHDLTDNRRGVVYVLDRFDPARRRFLKVTPYLTKLRNPNSVAFHTDASGRDWFYLALTDRLVRYAYARGADAPPGEPEVLATFPDYGLDYKYGGWHLTRTLAFGANGKLYVSVGSSCNACVEKEDVRATVVEMNPDGSGRRPYARGLRNAVGLRWADGALYATNMAADHLGKDKPADTMYALRAGTNYGWPYCYQSGPRVFADPGFNPRGRKMRCRDVPAALAAFDAHSAPLGLEHFGADAPEELAGSFLVALHGSTNKRVGRGYRVVRVPERGGAPADFITGFLQAGRVYGRPADIFAYGPSAFLLTDDRAGVVYYVYKDSRQ